MSCSLRRILAFCAASIAELVDTKDVCAVASGGGRRAFSGEVGGEVEDGITNPFI